VIQLGKHRSALFNISWKKIWLLYKSNCS